MKKVAIQAVKSSGRLAKNNFFKQHEVKLKTPRDLVTEIDIASEKNIIHLIKKSFPDHAILSEESGKQSGSEYLWIVDPIDGTTNYSIKNPFFDIAIAVAKDDEPVLAAVYAPMIDELFIAEQGKGAFMNGKRLHVSRENKLSDSLVVYCHYSSRKEVERVTRIFAKLKPLCRDFNRLRAAGVELSFVAAGRIGAYVSNGTQAWDIAAGALLVREAGGRVTDFSGNDWDITKNDMIASNGKIHRELVSILKRM